MLHFRFGCVTKNDVSGGEVAGSTSVCCVRLVCSSWKVVNDSVGSGYDKSRGIAGSSNGENASV